MKIWLKNLSFEKLKILAIASANAKSFYERLFFNSFKSEPDIISFFINYKKDDKKFSSSSLNMDLLKIVYVFYQQK